jgi:hypothetical protein
LVTVILELQSLHPENVCFNLFITPFRLKHCILSDTLPLQCETKSKTPLHNP